MTKILLTGASGFIGFALLKRLANKSSNEITAIDNFSRSVRDKEFEDLLRSSKNIKFVEMDLTERDQYSKLEKYYDEIYHLAAINGTKNFYERPYDVLRSGILATFNILENFGKDGFKKIVFASSSEAYAGTITQFGWDVPTDEKVPLTITDPFNPRWSYGGSKLADELIIINFCRKYGNKFSIIRYHNIYGPRMGYDHVVPEFLLRMHANENPFKIKGNATRTFCYIDDATAGTEQIMLSEKCDGHILNLGNDVEEITMSQLAERMFKVYDYYAELEVLPEPVGCVMRRCPNINKLRSLIHFELKVSLEEGLKKTGDWYFKN